MRALPKAPTGVPWGYSLHRLFPERCGIKGFAARDQAKVSAMRVVGGPCFQGQEEPALTFILDDGREVEASRAGLARGVAVVTLVDGRRLPIAESTDAPLFGQLRATLLRRARR